MPNGQIAFDIAQDVISSMKYFQYRIIASHMFKWTGLPPGLHSERLELMLIDRGSVAFFNTVTGPYILPYTSSGHVNVYGDLLNVRPLPLNGDILEPLDDVPRILWDNSARQTFDRYLRAFAARLAEIQTSISITEKQARFPSVIKMREENEESFTRFVSKVDQGYPVIYVDEAMPLEAFQVFNTGFNPEVFVALWNDYNKVEGEIYSLLGTMFNVEQNKASGVGPAETIINYAQTFAFANSRLSQRQDWCDLINEEFGSQIWCEKANDIQEIMEEMMGANMRDPEGSIRAVQDIKEAENSNANRTGDLRP